MPWISQPFSNARSLRPKAACLASGWARPVRLTWVDTLGDQPQLFARHERELDGLRSAVVEQGSPELARLRARSTLSHVSAPCRMPRRESRQEEVSCAWHRPPPRLRRTRVAADAHAWLQTHTRGCSRTRVAADAHAWLQRGVSLDALASVCGASFCVVAVPQSCAECASQSPQKSKL
eukprot:1575764-Rhodomonas_salina.1